MPCDIFMELETFTQQKTYTNGKHKSRINFISIKRLEKTGALIKQGLIGHHSALTMS